MSVRPRFTDDGYRREPRFRALVRAFLACHNEEHMMNFLRDIATLGELQDWSERFEICKQLAQGCSYRQIAKNLGVSTTTVSRVGKFLENGTGGLRKVLHTHRHHRLGSPKELNAVQIMRETGLTPHELTLEEKEAKKNPPSYPLTALQKYLQRKQ